MSEDPKTTQDGGDISSGHGDPQVRGPVSDEKAQEMLHEGSDNEDTQDASGDPTASAFAVSSNGEIVSEEELATDEQDPLSDDRPKAGGGGGGGGW